MNLVVNIIRREIEKNGPISFAVFMERALYAPDEGYYERNRDIGQRGDFFTSVSVGKVFGELLAAQFADWLQLTGSGPRQIVEAGAHNGQLAVDILDALQSRSSSVLQDMEYWIMEPSDARREWQAKLLGRWSGKVRWFGGWDEIQAAGVHGVIFSNELLDAMPVQSLEWDSEKRCFRERHVAWDGHRFTWQTSDVCSSSMVPPVEVAEMLPPGFLVEHAPAAIDWWEQAARTLRSGCLMAIDYGVTEEEMFRPEKGRGTLRSYYQHRATNDVLENPGQQDITAHVNFSALQRAGERSGLKTRALVSQGRFLTEVLQNLWKSASGSLVWDSARTRQFQTLSHPEHLGHSFRVLIQER